jgi:rSAM/selenodomain-associated transferase 1
MTGQMGPDRLLVFVKEPRPGAVKSRLARGIGAEAAATVSRVLAEHALRRTAPSGDEYERVVFFTPAAARAEVARWLPGTALRAQAEGDLGARMAAAFDEAFGTGARRVVIVGTDVPGLGREDVREALEGLDEHDVVVGPATDGGYYLLALKAPAPELFRAVPWSTPGVLAATLERAAHLGRSVRVLRTLGDVDTVEDLAADWGRIAPLLPEPVRREIAVRVGKG